MDAKEPVAPDVVDELIQALPPHLRENLETAERQLVEEYGMSPGMPALMRQWIAFATSWRIRRQFECAVLNIQRKSRDPQSGSEIDEEDGL